MALFQSTTATRKIAKLKKRIRAVQGGTSASKTISIILLFIHLSQTDSKPKISSIVSETLPHLKKGAIRDFITIMQAHNYYKDDAWNRSDCIYTFETGSKIEFFSADQPGKVRGPRRDRLFVNEVNNISYETFDQLEVRTKDFIFLDWNPAIEFWFYDKDNEALDNNIVKSIEQHKDNKNWWLVYGLGQLGEVEGKIYKNWKIIDDIPHEARLERRGLDFGYSNDPSSLVDIYKYNDGFIIDERIHQKGLSNKQIADVILNLEEKEKLVIADSAEPKSIDEIMSYGVNILPCKKGQGSVNQGIQFVQDQKISVTKRSVSIIKEYRNYIWKTDRDGKILNVPEDIFNHAMDAIRYGLDSYRNIERKAYKQPDFESGSEYCG